jgi:hypothetical protein
MVKFQEKSEVFQCYIPGSPLIVFFIIQLEKNSHQKYAVLSKAAIFRTFPVWGWFSMTWSLGPRKEFRAGFVAGTRIPAWKARGKSRQGNNIRNIPARPGVLFSGTDFSLPAVIMVDVCGTIV